MCYCWLDSQQHFTCAPTWPTQFARDVDDSKPQRAASRRKPMLVVDQCGVGNFVGHELAAVLDVQKQRRNCRTREHIVKRTGLGSWQGSAASGGSAVNTGALHPLPHHASLCNWLYAWKARLHLAEVTSGRNWPWNCQSGYKSRKQLSERYGQHRAQQWGRRQGHE